jgi:hypothetical protein
MVIALNGLRKCAVTDRFSRDNPAFPARWFTAYTVLSPVNQHLPPSSARSYWLRANLTPARARQDHTTSPSAPALLVSQPIRVHRIPLHVRDDRDTPLVSVRNERE